MLPLGLFSGFPDLVLPEDVRHRLERSFNRELGDWRRAPSGVVPHRLVPLSDPQYVA
jgi:hypothetical protein